MKPHLYTFSFKKFLLGVFFAIFLLYVFSFVANYIIEKSNYRLSKIYSEQIIENKIFFIGNSRSVPFTENNLKNSKILNLSNNSMNAFEVNNIIRAIKEKKNDNIKIFIEITALNQSLVQCRYTLFYNLKFYYGKDDIKKYCNQKLLIENIIPLTKINNELFYRVLYYFIYPKKDQLWTNNYKISNSICQNPTISPFTKSILTVNSFNNMLNNSKKIFEKFTDKKTKIYYFITPFYNKENFALNLERKFLQEKIPNFIGLNSELNSRFFKNCNMFADTLHLSPEGLKEISKTSAIQNLIN